MSKIIKLLMVLGLLVFTCLYRPGTAHAASPPFPPFTCSSNFYQVISGQLKLLDPVTGQYTNIGDFPGFDYNAIGYNVLDNYIYGIIQTGPNVGDLIKVASNGAVEDLGLPAGLPASNWFNGDMDLSGNLYIEANSNTIYKVNVASMTTTTLTTGGDPMIGASDNVFINNKLYLLDGSTLSVVDLNTDIVTTGTVSGPSGWLTAGNSFGAGWADGNGNLFFSNNNSGSIYQILDYNSLTPTAVFKVTGTVTSVNDGANCHLSVQNPFDPPVAVNDSYIAPFDGTLTETLTPVLANDTGNTLTVTSHTSPAHGKLKMNSDGSFVYTPAKGFSGTDSFTYTITDSAGRTATATVTIVVDPASPNTGYGTPDHTSSLRSGLVSVAFISISSGLWLLYRQKKIHPRKYKLNY